MKKVKKMQSGGKATADSTAYFKNKAKDDMKLAVVKSKYGLKNEAEKNMKTAKESLTSASRQFYKGKPGYDKNGYPVKKMQNGGSLSGLKASTKRVGPVDPDGAWTKVQERTIAGKKAPKVPLKKDKQLGATKMKMGGKMKKK